MLVRRLSFAAALAFVWSTAGCHEVHFESKVVEGVIDIHDDLYAVAVPDAEHAVAVGYYGAIYRTEDGGDTWHKSSNETDQLLYDVGMADAARGWAVGQIGLVLRSEDGGRTWQHQPTVKETEGSHLFSLHVIDANTAWAVGEWGTRIFTDDGGISWQDLSLTIDPKHPTYVWLSPAEQEKVRRGENVFEDITLNDVYCRPAPSQHCWMVGEFGYIFWSDNQGRTWQRGEIVCTEKIDPVVFEYNETDFSGDQVERLKIIRLRAITAPHSLRVPLGPEKRPHFINAAHPPITNIECFHTPA